MKLLLITAGKTDFSFLKEGISLYTARIKRYTSFDYQEFSLSGDIVKAPPDTIRVKEGEKILQKLDPSDFLVLLDEKGSQFRSTELAEWLNQLHNRQFRRLVFIIGGSYGFSKEVYDRANFLLSLSKLTLPHQLARLLFLEQLYRAYTILRNEPYHNEG